MERISADSGTKFISMDFQDKYQTRGVWFTLADTYHLKMNRRVEVTHRTLHTIKHSLMVHARALEDYIHFALMYTADNILPVLPIKDLINEDGERTMSFKLATGTKTSVWNLRVLFVHFCTKSYCTCWDKSVKYASPSAEGFSWHLFWNSTASERVSCLCTPQMQDRIFVRCCS